MAAGLVDSDAVQAKVVIEEARSRIDHVREQEIREISHVLHPSVIKLGLGPAMRPLADRFRSVLDVRLFVDPRLDGVASRTDVDVSSETRLTAYRVLEEALANVRSPMTAVRAAADLLADETLDFERDQRGRVVTALHSGVRRLERIMQESLAYAELKGAGLDLLREEMDMREAVLDAVLMVRPSASAKQQQIDVASPMLSVSVYADPARIEQVLVNLPTNAVKFAPEQGRILVSVRNENGGVGHGDHQSWPTHPRR